MLSKVYNVNFLNPLLDAVVNVLGTMAGFEVTPGKPYRNDTRTAREDITGLIEISGYAHGVIGVSLSKGAVLKIVNNMLFENFTEFNEEIEDAVGELTNMIAGQARSGLSEQGFSFQASTPEVVVGKGFPLDHIPSAPVLGIPFTSAEGSLAVEFSLTQSD
ncbi:MAG: chemotaxis protein CheX [Desulfonatronovibrionaceae bacterium]